MARPRARSTPDDSGIRAALAADLRESAEQIYPTARESGFGGGPDPAGWLRKADDLDAGAPVVLPGWEVARYVDGPYPATVPAFRIEPDGSVTAMRTVHGGDTVHYVPDDGPALWRPSVRPRWEKPSTTRSTTR